MDFETKVRLHKDLKAFEFSLEGSDVLERVKALRKLESTKATNSVHFSRYDKLLMDEMIKMLRDNKVGMEFKI